MGGSAVWSMVAWYLLFELAMLNMFLSSQSILVCLLPKTEAFLAIPALWTVLQWCEDNANLSLSGNQAQSCVYQGLFELHSMLFMVSEEL